MRTFAELEQWCAGARLGGAPFLFKQWGAWDWVYAGEPRQAKAQLVDDGAGPGGCIKMWRVGKKKAGRTLDGRKHSDFPTMREAICRKAP